MAQLEFGLNTFGDVTADLQGKSLSHPEVIRNIVAEGVLADKTGLDFFGIGEHHRDDFAVSSPEMILAAIAGRTSRIRLGSAVTVLSSDDPVKVYQRFSTLNALSDGRADIMMGRGSFIESFPLFGFDLSQYEVLFENKLKHFDHIVRTGKAENGLPVYPKAEKSLRTWIAVGGTPKSVIRAAQYGYPLMIAIIGGDPAAFKPLVDLYRKSWKQYGNTTELLVGSHSHGYVARTDEEAREEVWPHYKAMMDRIGRDRGWPPLTRGQFEDMAGPHGALFVGSPETVATKVIRVMSALGLTRWDMKYSIGSLPHEKLMMSIELFAKEVIPLVRKADSFQ